MRNQRSILYVALYILFGTAALMTVRADQPVAAGNTAAAPEGSPARISEWAFAGVIWSDASLVEKLAKQAAAQSQSAADAEAYSQLAAEASNVIASLETFGWRQVDRRTANAAAATGANAATTRSAAALNRRDTETPAGRDDPGIDNEQLPVDTSLDLDRYRVDDYVDETPTEAANRADALEDGVEGAIAAASPRGTGGPVAGRVSQREVMTRSSTMAYSVDSIYDRDDFDPDRDYQVDNPAGILPTNSESADRGDQDDDIDVNEPAIVVDGEDELAASMARNRSTPQSVGSVRQPVEGDRAAAVAAETLLPSSLPNTDLDRYTDQRESFQQDANWVQFHLDANQRLWSELSGQQDPVAALQIARKQMRANAAVAIQNSDNATLNRVLQTILKL